MEQQVFNDRYKVVAKIGSGGMAEVYKAIDSVLDRPVAVKVLHRHFAEDEDFVSRFKREAQAAAALNHPNIVSIYDWGSQNGTYFIVMELLEGQSLKEYLTSKGKLSPMEAMEISRKVLSALNFAHKHDIVHRDIKPHNIILTRDGEVKVTDFGIARAGASTMTQTGTILGTAHYLSPEQARGQDVGLTSDIYAMGVVLYEMVTGKIPFDGENPVAIALKHVHEAPTPPRELNPEISEGLQTIIAKAMAKNPESRYQNATEMRSDIMRLMEGMPITAVAPDEQETMIMSAPSQTMRVDRTMRERPARSNFMNSSGNSSDNIPKKRRRGPLIAILALFIIIAAGAGIFAGVLNQTKMMEVPDVQKKSFEEAERILKEKGLKIKKKGDAFSNTLEENFVITQDPAPGSKLEEGGTVSVIVSRGKKTVEVPDVTGDREAMAATQLIKAGLEVGDTKYENSDDVEDGAVISTNPPAGESVSVGTKVNLIVSKGVARAQVPDVYGSSESDAKKILKDAGFEVQITQQFDDDVDKGKVIRTSPPSGNELKKGSTITVYVSKGTEKITVPDVRGKLEDEAIDMLESAGFTVDVKEVDGVASDNDSKVISQDPSGGEEVKKKDASVTIYVGRAD